MSLLDKPMKQDDPGRLLDAGKELGYAAFTSLAFAALQRTSS